MDFKYDVIVIGAGHAGCEAAAAAANLGSKTCLITMDMNKIGQMSCNPAVGGIAKGQIVREIDALGGQMGLVTDGIRSKVHFNLSDNTDGTPGYIAACVSAFTNDEADLYNSHVYKFDYNTPNSTLVNWERQNIASAGGKRHFVGEFGFPGYGSARQYGIDTYTRDRKSTRLNSSHAT